MRVPLDGGHSHFGQQIGQRRTGARHGRLGILFAPRDCRCVGVPDADDRRRVLDVAALHVNLAVLHQRFGDGERRRVRCRLRRDSPLSVVVPESTSGVTEQQRNPLRDALLVVQGQAEDSLFLCGRSDHRIARRRCRRGERCPVDRFSKPLSNQPRDKPHAVLRVCWRPAGGLRDLLAFNLGDKTGKAVAETRGDNERRVTHAVEGVGVGLPVRSVGGDQCRICCDLRPVIVRRRHTDWRHGIIHVQGIDRINAAAAPLAAQHQIAVVLNHGRDLGAGLVKAEDRWQQRTRTGDGQRAL